LVFPPNEKWCEVGPVVELDIGRLGCAAPLDLIDAPGRGRARPDCWEARPEGSSLRPRWRRSRSHQRRSAGWAVRVCARPVPDRFGAVPSIDRASPAQSSQAGKSGLGACGTRFAQPQPRQRMGRGEPRDVGAGSSVGSAPVTGRGSEPARARRQGVGLRGGASQRSEDPTGQWPPCGRGLRGGTRQPRRGLHLTRNGGLIGPRQVGLAGHVSGCETGRDSSAGSMRIRRPRCRRAQCRRAECRRGCRSTGYAHLRSDLHSSNAPPAAPIGTKRSSGPRAEARGRLEVCHGSVWSGAARVPRGLLGGVRGTATS